MDLQERERLIQKVKEQERFTQRIQELEEEWTRLDSTEIPATPAGMEYYTKRVNKIMKEIADLKKTQSSALH